MRRIAMLFGSVGLLVIFYGVALAQIPLDGITWDANSPSSPDKGRIIGSGSYVLDKKYTVLAVSMTATNKDGKGEVKTETGSYNSTTKAWSALITNLKGGTYKVKARLTYYEPPFGKFEDHYTSEKEITVKAP